MAPAELVHEEPRLHVHWMSLVSAVAIVSVLAALVLPRLSPTEGRIDGGRVLGETVDVPLRVSITVAEPNSRMMVTTTSMTGTLAEVIAQAASALHGDFSYVSRGDSIYLSVFDGRINNQAGHWTVALNGQPVTDLTQAVLHQNDQITLQWQ